MKVISVHQPFAAAIAIGAKKFETRSWPTKYRGPLAIHATVDAAILKRKEWPPFWRAALGPLIREGWQGVTPELAFGAVVAVVELWACHRVEEVDPDQHRFAVVTDGPPLVGIERQVAWTERQLGNWAPGGFAWELVSPRRLRGPVAVKGQQGLWTLPPAVAKQVEIEVAAYQSAHPPTRLDPRQQWPFKGGR